MKKLIISAVVFVGLLGMVGCAYKGAVNINLAGSGHSSTNAVNATTEVPVSDVANGNTVTPTGL